MLVKSLNFIRLWLQEWIYFLVLALNRAFPINPATFLYRGKTFISAVFICNAHKLANN